MPVDWKAHSRRVIEQLGDDWTLKPASGAKAYTVRGIFASAPLAVLEEGRAGVAVSQPSLVVMAEDVISAAVDDVLEPEREELRRALGRYTIAEKPPGEQPSGKITLILELKE